MSAPLVSWDAISLRVDGKRANQLAREAKVVDDITLDFRNGNIHITGWKKVKILPVPFWADVQSIAVQGKTIVVSVDIAGVPGFLLPLIREVIASKIPVKGVTVRPPLTFVIQLDRFLPTFVELDIREIRMIDGGLQIGPGGASWK
jgi:hypothetical protein